MELFVLRLPLLSLLSLDLVCAEPLLLEVVLEVGFGILEAPVGILDSLIFSAGLFTGLLSVGLLACDLGHGNGL